VGEVHGSAHSQWFMLGSLLACGHGRAAGSLSFSSVGRVFAARLAPDGYEAPHPRPCTSWSRVPAGEAGAPLSCPGLTCGCRSPLPPHHQRSRTRDGDATGAGVTALHQLASRPLDRRFQPRALHHAYRFTQDWAPYRASRPAPHPRPSADRCGQLMAPEKSS
jgi:hypothetical protein